MFRRKTILISGTPVDISEHLRVLEKLTSKVNTKLHLVKLCKMLFK